MSETYRKSVLPSGLTLVTESVPHRESVSMGVWVRRGARDEPTERLGISHFVEHMMFKGTARRDARAIAESLESLGGHLDAFTAREQVCYYARALSEHLRVAVDVLADIVCASRFAEIDIAREKSVVREEIFACEDNPEDKVSEMLSAQVWSDHPLGKPILGTVETVDAFDRDALRAHHRSSHRPEHLVVAAAGALEHEAMAEVIEKHFDAGRADGPHPESGPPPTFVPTIRHDVRDDLQQLYLSLGTRGIHHADPRRYAVVVLNTLLGGGMSSRLFQSVREEAGLAYSIYSAVDFYRDAGMFSIHLGVSPAHAREALARVREELHVLCDRGPGEEEVAAARSQIAGSVRMGYESVSNRMYHLAYEEVYGEPHTTAADQVERVNAVTLDEVTEAARTFLAPGRFAISAIGPASGEPIHAADWPM